MGRNSSSHQQGSNRRRSYHREGIVLLVVGFWLGNLQVGLSQDSLQSLRDNVRRPPAPVQPKPPKKDDHDDHDHDDHDHDHHGYFHGHHHDDDDDGFGATLLFLGAVAAGYAVTSPFWAPAKLVGDDYSAAGYFPRYPYMPEVDGAMMIKPWLPVEPRCWSVRARAECADNFNRGTRAGGHVLFDTSYRFGLDTAFDFRSQETAGVVDELWTGDVNLVFRFAQSPRLQMRAGLGANWLGDRIGSEFGFNFTYGGDWFPTRPWVISSEIDWGFLGSATLFHFRASAGVVFHGFEVYAGYDYYDVGTSQFDGLVSGIRIWY